MISTLSDFTPRYATAATNPTATASTPAASEATPPKSDAAATPGSPSKLTSSGMGRDEFLKMLVAQLKNQDPLNPMDGKDMAAQLAQFSTVEQLIAMNKSLEAQAGDSKALTDAMTTGLADLKTAQAEQSDALTTMIEGQMAVSMVGKTGVTTGNAMYVDRDGNGTMLVDAGAVKGAARARIIDAKGVTVGTYELGELTGGQQAFDLKSVLGKDVEALPPGKYTYAVEVAKDGGSWQQVKSYTTGRITGLKYDQGNPILIIGDSLAVPMSQLTQVRS